MGDRFVGEESQKSKNKLIKKKTTNPKTHLRRGFGGRRMKTIKNDWLMWTILLIPFVFIIMYWDKFPEKIATHFDMSGNPNDYSGKAFGLLIKIGRAHV